MICRDALSIRPTAAKPYVAAVALAMVTVHAHIARLARVVVGDGHGCPDVALLNQVSEVLSREYIR